MLRQTAYNIGLKTLLGVTFQTNGSFMSKLKWIKMRDRTKKFKPYNHKINYKFLKKN